MISLFVEICRFFVGLSLQQINTNQVGGVSNFPANNFNAIYSQVPVYRSVPYQFNNMAMPFGAYKHPLKALKRAYIAQQLQAATGQVK